MTPEQEVMLVSTAIDAIGKIISAVRSAKAGQLDPAVAIASIKVLLDEDKADNATIDVEEAKKFPTG
jgi:hypothetical protein